jgi:hypothetical protein
MLPFLFLRYLSDNYEEAARKELGDDYVQCEGFVSEIRSAKSNEAAESITFGGLSIEQLENYCFQRKRRTLKSTC